MSRIYNKSRITSAHIRGPIRTEDALLYLGQIKHGGINPLQKIAWNTISWYIVRPTGLHVASSLGQGCFSTWKTTPPSGHYSHPLRATLNDSINILSFTHSRKRTRAKCFVAFTRRLEIYIFVVTNSICIKRAVISPGLLATWPETCSFT